MNKRNLYSFSIELRGLIEKNKIDEAISKIEAKNLSEEEKKFVFECLKANGYDPVTDSFILYESDNSAFLALVNKVENKFQRKSRR